MFTLSLEHPYDGKHAPDVGAYPRVCPRRAGTQAPPLRHVTGVFEGDVGKTFAPERPPHPRGTEKGPCTRDSNS